MVFLFLIFTTFLFHNKFVQFLKTVYKRKKLIKKAKEERTFMYATILLHTSIHNWSIVCTLVHWYGNDDFKTNIYNNIDKKNSSDFYWNNNLSKHKTIGKLHKKDKRCLRISRQFSQLENLSITII